jgi:hypothetical protein
VQGVRAVLPNHDDLSFIKVVLDPTSYNFFSKNYAKIQDPLVKGLFVAAALNAVKDVRLYASDFVD